MQGAMATVEESTLGTKKVCFFAPPPICLIPPSDFLDVLHWWGQTWIWDNLKVTGGTQVQTHGIITGYDRVEMVPGGDDIDGDHKHSAAIHCH